MEETDGAERKETAKTRQPETSKRRNETENLRTSEELVRISKDITKANNNIRVLQRNLASTMGEIDHLNYRLRAANETRIQIDDEIRQNQDEKDRLTATLTEARGFCSEATLYKNLLLMDTSEVAKTSEIAVIDDDCITTCIGGIRTTDIGIKGIALLENFIYVLCRSLVEGSQIRVFGDKTFKFNLNKVIELSACLDPYGLSANPEAQCLYVTDRCTDWLSNVWKVTPEDDQVTEWTSCPADPIVSVSLFGHILLLYYFTGDGQYHIDVRLSTGEMLLTRVLPHEASGDPLAIVETSSRDFIISFEIYKTYMDTHSWCIYKMNANCQIIRRFTPGDDPSQRLYNPRFLFVDSWDRVIVADSGSNRVILLDSNLNWNGVLLKRAPFVIDESSRPFLYDNRTNKIFIGPSYDEFQRIDVFTLKLRPPEEMESKDDPSYQSPPLACSYLNQLPDVMLERILLKACLLKSSLQTTEDFLALAAVAGNWYHQLKNKRMHKMIKRHMAAHRRIVHCRKHTIRNNQKYLIESIRPAAKVVPEGVVSARDRDLIDRLYDVGCLSDKEVTFVRGRNQRSIDVNKELLNIARSFDATKYAMFVECLRQDNQMTSADVLERGGVTIEMKLILAKESKRFTEEIISSINKIRDKTFPQKKEFEELIIQLMAHEIEILDAHKKNRGIAVLWLWCHSPESLSRLRELSMPIGHRPSDLFGITDKLVKTISQAIVLKRLRIEEKQWQQDVSICPIPIESRKIWNIRGREFYGVVKLKNMIFILSQKPKLLQVCSERPPFPLLKSVEIKKIQNPRDMTAGPDCLYVVESFTEKSSNKEVRSVSKIVFESEDFAQYRVLRWLPNMKESFALSSCKDGRLLLMRHSQPSTLEIYGSRAPDNDQASLERTIILDEDFCRLQHAVETQNGHFVLSHFLASNSKCFISEINQSGQTVRRFYARNQSQQVLGAVALAVDSHGRVFVADCNNDQVVMLDAQLKWIQVVLTSTKDGLTGPCALWYDENMKQLIAAQSYAWKACSYPKTSPAKMEPAIYVVSNPDLTKDSL